MENDKKTSKKREWIKNIAIIFLSILLILTFFSNTIMNYSLPQVATDYVSNGMISNKIRGTGVVEAVDPYHVVVNETRVIKSVAVKVDDNVQKGDVLYYLEDEKSEELIEAKEQLAAAELEYDKLVLRGGVSAARLKEIQAGKVQSLEENQGSLAALQTQIDAAQASVDSLSKQISLLEQNKVDATAESNALASAQVELNNARVDLSRKSAAYAALESRPDEDPEKTEAATALANAQELVWQLEAKVANAQINLEQKLGSQETANQIAQLQRQKIDAEATLNAKTQEKTALLDKILLEMDIVEAYRKLTEQKAKIEELENKAIGATVVSPVSGRVTSLSYAAGEKTTAGEEAAVIQVEGKGMMLSFSTGIKQANVIRVGDPVEVQNAWFYSEISANLTAIKTDPNNPREQRLLVFEIHGTDVMPGDSLTLAVGQRSMNYDFIVPNSAVREDNNGKFILIVKSKSTPFGNRYVAERVDVEVLASDDMRSAVNGLLEGYEYVITTSTKPIEAGDQVRFDEGMN